MRIGLRVIFFCGLILLCAGGVFAYLVLASVHESTLRDAGSVADARLRLRAPRRDVSCGDRDAMSADDHESAGVYVGTRNGAVWASLHGLATLWAQGALSGAVPSASLEDALNTALELLMDSSPGGTR